MEKVNGKSLANRLLDDYIELYGVIRAIQYLIDLGYSEQELIMELDFDMSDIIKAKNEETEY